MKEIKNWQAIIKNEQGKEEIAILLPGCIIKGEFEDREIEIETIDVDISNLIVTSLDNQVYLLCGANREYLNSIAKCIEIGKEERNGEER